MADSALLAKVALRVGCGDMVGGVDLDVDVVGVVKDKVD